MNKVWKWILIFLGALVVVFLAAMAFFSRIGIHRVAYYGGGIRRGFGMMGWGGMGFFHPLGWLLGLVVLGLAIYGIVALFSHNHRSTTPPPMPKTCPHCSKVVDKDWVSCPYCGQDLRAPAPVEPKPEDQEPQ